MTFTHKDGTSFTVYAKTIKDAKKMILFIETLIAGIIEKAHKQLIAEGWTKNAEIE